MLNSTLPTLFTGTAGFIDVWCFYSFCFFFKQGFVCTGEFTSNIKSYFWTKQFVQNQLSAWSLLIHYIHFQLSSQKISHWVLSVFRECSQNSLPCCHARPTSTKSPVRIKILPASTKPVQVILHMNSKCSPNNATVITIYSLPANSWVFT